MGNIFQAFGGYIKESVKIGGTKQMKKETSIPKPPEPPKDLPKFKEETEEELMAKLEEIRKKKEEPMKIEEPKEETMRVQVMSEYEVVMIKLNQILEILTKTQ